MTTGVLSDSTVTATAGDTNTLAAWLAGITVSGTNKTLSGIWTAAAHIPTSSVVPTNGMYLPAANTLGWAANTTAEMQMTGTALSPATSNGLALGTTTLMWSDAFFASGSVINFNNGDVTLTHSADNLAFAGGKLAATYNSTDASGATQILSVGGNQSVAHTGKYSAGVFTPTYSAASGNTLAGLYGLYTAATNTSTGTVNQAFGVSANAVNDAGGTITSALGVSGVTVNSSSGTVTNANGGRFEVSNRSTGTITTAYGVVSGLDNTNAGGTVTTFYSVFLATPTNSGTIVNRFGLYQQDAASKNVLFGRTLIGGTTDDGVNKLRVSGGVTVDTGNSYKVNNVAVVGATKTGWTAATGTATRTTFVTSTVTTEQLAQRVKALLDDLISHGLIGT